MTVIPCFWKSAIVCSRKRACSTSGELPSRSVYVRSSKQRELPAVFLMSRPGPHGGVAACAGNVRGGAGTARDAGPAAEPSMAMVRYMIRVFTGSPVLTAKRCGHSCPQSTRAVSLKRVLRCACNPKPLVPQRSVTRHVLQSPILADISPMDGLEDHPRLL